MEKPIRYATIPETFNQEKHYIEQLPPVDMGEYIWVDVVVRDLDLADAPPVEQPHVEPAPYAPEPTTEEVLQELITVLVDKGVLY